MKIISWNLNSIRARKEQLVILLKNEKPDFVCLQETKVSNDSFPEEPIKKLNYHIFKNGMASYNGVSILSTLPPKDIKTQNFCKKSDCRHIEISFEKIRIHSIYVPAGGEEPDPLKNKKFKHKLKFLDEMFEFFSKNKKFNHIVCGDFNVAPFEDDVWSHNNLKNVVSHTDIERKKILKVLNDCNFEDTIRKFISPPKNIFTWWSYRSPDFTKNNRGRRLDHIWTSKKKFIKTNHAKILIDYRRMTKPSDHVPISMNFSF
ncbi:MAG: exodeoxyribonuclease III [Rickettsiales bacterium]|nr:exodeoxyribonuclease III [Rickettsiales bacterium]